MIIISHLSKVSQTYFQGNALSHKQFLRIGSGSSSDSFWYGGHTAPFVIIGAKLSESVAAPHVNLFLAAAHQVRSRGWTGHKYYFLSFRYDPKTQLGIEPAPSALVARTQPILPTARWTQNKVT